MPQPVLSTWRTSALSSPLVSFRNSMCGAARRRRRRWRTTRLVGMLRCSAKTVNLSARPSPLVSSTILMRSSPGAPLSTLVRIVDRLDDPQPPALVEVERDRLDDVRLAGEELELELRRHLDELHRVVRRERQLILRRRIAALVVRHDEACRRRRPRASSSSTHARRAGSSTRPDRAPARSACGTPGLLQVR